MKGLLIAVVMLLSTLGGSLDVFAEQKIVICGESSRLKDHFDEFRPLCEQACRTPRIEDYLKNGWKIVTNQPTRFIPNISEDTAKAILKDAVERGLLKNSATTETIKSFSTYFCECGGTKYVLSMEEKKVEIAPEPDKNNKNMELLKKEIELLKKENDMLKKDGEALKQENEALKKKTTKKK